MLGFLLRDYTVPDILIIAFLCVAFPAYQLVMSVRRARESERPADGTSFKRMLRAIATLGVPLVVLALDWNVTGRSTDALGLGFRIGAPGQIGFGLAGGLILALLIMSRLPFAKQNPERAAEQQALLDAAGMAPRSHAELALFVVLAFVIGCGSEILFRGFLLWAIAPRAGVAGAVVVAALAYGIGHGYKSWQQAAGSILSAFAFTIGYALTHSLWWLMLIHTFIGLYAGIGGYLNFRRAAHSPG